MNLLNNIFDKIYCITCVDDTNRQEKVIQQIIKYHMDLEFIPSINKNYINNDILKVSKSEASLCLSHKQCIESALLNDYKSILIFEDDFSLNNNWELILQEFLQNIPTAWDILWLGMPEWTRGLIENHMDNVNQYVNRMLSIGGSHAMGVYNSVYTKCINEISKLNNPVDFAYTNVMMLPDVYCYGPVKNIVDAISLPHSKYHDKIIGFDKNKYVKSSLRDEALNP